MHKVFKYNIHGIDIISDIPCAPAYFQASQINEPHLIVRKVGDIEIDKSKLRRIGLSFYGGKNLFYFEYRPFPKLAIKMLVRGLFQKKTEILFNRYALIAQRLGRFAKRFSIRSIADFIIDCKLLEKGRAPIHSAGVEKNGNACLISAWSETGKTSTMLALAKNGFNLLGDDQVYVSRCGKVLCYPLQVGLFYHTKNLQGIELPLMTRIKLRTKYLFSKIRLLDMFISATERIELSKVGNIKKSGEIHKIFLLENSQTKEVMKISREEAINRILASSATALQVAPVTRAFFSAPCYFEAKDPSMIERKSRNIIKEGLRKADCFLLRGTKEEFPAMILNEVEGDKR